MDVDALVAVADEALAGLEHRRVDFDHADVADSTARRLPGPWLEGHAPGVDAPRDPAAARAADRGAGGPLRRRAPAARRVDGEDSPGQDSSGYHAQAREVALRRQVRVLAVYEGEVPVAFAHLEHDGDAAEITQVFVHPAHRGGGRGTAMTRAAIDAAGDVRDLWIVADDEDRPKELYARLGFRPAWATMEFTRWPRT